MGRYPWPEALLFEVLHITILYPTRQNAYRAVVLAAMICVTAKIYLLPEITGSVGMIYSLGAVISFQSIFTAYLLFAEGTFPDHWRRVRDEVHGKDNGAGGSDKLPSSFPLREKLWWMVDMAFSVRMIGWVQEPRDAMPPHPPPSRRTFLWKTFSKFIANAIVADFLAFVFNALSTTVDYPSHDPADGPKAYLAALLCRVPYTLSYGIGAGAVISAMHNAVALVCVGLGHSGPTLWPDIWGRWGDAYTLRKLWGRTWHQWLRPSLSGFGRLVASKLLKFPRGTNRSSYTQLYIAFFLSGLLHFAAEFLIEMRMVYRAPKFFLLQAVAITFEDFVIYIAKRALRRGGIELNPGRPDESWAEAVVRVIGYCWVTLWFCSTLPGWLGRADTIGPYSSDGGPTHLLLDTWKQRA